MLPLLTAEKDICSTAPFCWHCRFLNLAGMPLSGTIPSSLARTQSLECASATAVFPLPLCLSCTVVPPSAGACSSAPRPSLAPSPLTSATCPCRTALSNALQFCGCHILSHTHTCCDSVCGCIPCSVLWLNNNNLTGTLPRSLCALANLRDFEVQGNSISGTIPDCVGALTRMSSFMVNNNKLSGSIPDAITQCTLLQCGAVPVIADCSFAAV